MIVYRIDHPSNGIGPFRNGAIKMSKRDDQRFMDIVKGPNHEKYKTCSPAPKHEIDLADARRDKTFYDCFGKFCRLRPTIETGLTTDAIYGFTSRDALERWFSMDKELAALLTKYGYQESLYRVDDDRVLEYYHQCSFRQCDAELIQRRPI